MKKALFFIAGAMLVGAVCLVLWNAFTFSLQTGFVTLNDVQYSVMISDTPGTRIKGLSGRNSLAPYDGMLFIFDAPDTHAFWMKDMKFPLDIIWLDKKGAVVHIEKNISPDTYPRSFVPPQKSLYVLEFNAGFSDKNHLSVGNIFKISRE